MKSLFVPKPLVPAFLASGVDRDVWFKPGFSLTSIVSPSDVAFYIHANVESHRQYSGALVRSFPNSIVTDELISAWIEGDWTTGPAAASEAEAEAKRKIKLAWNELALAAAKNNGQSDAVTTDIAPTVLYISDAVVVYTIDAEANTAATDGWYDFIAKLHPFYQFEELAELPVFAAYLEHRPTVLRGS